MKKSIQVTTLSTAHSLPVLKVSDLFSHAARCAHSGHYKAIKSPFESELCKQGYAISLNLNGYGSGLTDYIFLKPSPELLTSLNLGSSVLDYVGLSAVNNGSIIVTLITGDPRCPIRHKHETYAGFITPEDLTDLKALLNTKARDHHIELV